jgi:hypothetical protein
MSESQKQNTAISFTTYVLMINNSMQKQNLSEPTRHNITGNARKGGPKGHLCGRPCTSRRRRCSTSAPLQEYRGNKLKAKTSTGGQWNRSGDGGGAPRAVTTGVSAQTISVSGPPRSRLGVAGGDLVLMFRGGCRSCAMVAWNGTRGGGSELKWFRNTSLPGKYVILISRFCTSRARLTDSLLVTGLGLCASLVVLFFFLVSINHPGSFFFSVYTRKQ